MPQAPVGERVSPDVFLERGRGKAVVDGSVLDLSGYERHQPVGVRQHRPYDLSGQPLLRTYHHPGT